MILNKRDDMFYHDLYLYYTRGGYKCIVIENILSLIVTLSTLFLLLFSAFWFDWMNMIKCTSDNKCNNLTNYIVNPFKFHNRITIGCMITFMSMFSLYWLWMFIGLMREIITFHKYKHYYKQLGVINDNFGDIHWNDIVKKIIQTEYKQINVDNSVDLQRALHQQYENLINSIMRTDNYAISIIGSDLLKINTGFYTRTFLWYLKMVILDNIFYDNHQTQIFRVDRNKIKKNLRIISFFQLLLLPFLIIIFIVKFIINTTTDIYTKKTFSRANEWNLYSLYVFREYNELPHIFNDRIEKSYKYADKYEKKFNNRMLNMVLEKIIFTFGSYLTLLVIVMFFDDRLLIYITLFKRNLLWYVAVITSIITICRLMMIYPTNTIKSHDDIMKLMAQYTHYYPHEWSLKIDRNETLYKFQMLYTNKIANVIIELIGKIMIPYYIFTNKNKYVDTILDHIEKNTIYVDGIGHTFNNSIKSSVEFSFDDIDSMIRDDDKLSRSLINFDKYYNLTESNDSIYEDI